MSKLLLFPILFILFFASSMCFGQAVNPNNYDAFMKEVYGDTPYLTSELKTIYIERMQQVKVEKWDGVTNYPILETLHLVNKYHPEIEYDHGDKFNPEEFNPLKYFFDFNSNSKYKVRDADYIIVISKK